MLDYCLNEWFNATCDRLPGHVILMTSARFGRMASGRCISGELDVGCVKDVLRRLSIRPVVLALHRLVTDTDRRWIYQFDPPNHFGKTQTSDRHRQTLDLQARSVQPFPHDTSL